MKKLLVMTIALTLVFAYALNVPAQEQEEEKEIEDEVPMLTTPGMTYGMGYGYGWGQRYSGQGWGPGMGMRHGMMNPDMMNDMDMGGPAVWMMAELDLTADQREKILDIHKDLMNDKIDMIKEMREKRQEIAALHTQEDPDSEQMRELMVEMAELRADMYTRTLEARKEAMAVLTDEQKEVLGDRSLFGGPGMMQGPGMMGPGMMQGPGMMGHPGMMKQWDDKQHWKNGKERPPKKEMKNEMMKETKEDMNKEE